jgi:hypothetical protein
MSSFNEKPREACGIFGIYEHPEAAALTYFGLYALQHRGQESAGITCRLLSIRVWGWYRMFSTWIIWLNWTVAALWGMCVIRQRAVPF